MNKLLQKTIVIIVIVCHALVTNTTFAFSQDEIKYCNNKKLVYEKNCTYLKQKIENAVIEENKITENIEQDDISLEINDFITHAQTVAFICLLPISVASLPFSLFGLWSAMFYSIYTNDSLKIFR